MNLRICLVTAASLSTAPRMLKVADALADAGHHVHLISTRHVEWANRTDAEVRKTRSWDWTVVDYDRKSAPVTYWRSGVRYHSARMLANAIGPSHCLLSLAARAYSRVHTELVQAAVA